MKKDKIQSINSKCHELEHMLVSALVTSPSLVKSLVSLITPDDLRSSHQKPFKIIYDAFFADEEASTALFRHGVSVHEYVKDTYLSPMQLATLVGHIKNNNFAYKLLGLLEESYSSIDADKIEEDYSSFHGKLIALAQGKGEETWDIKSLMGEFEKEQTEHSEKIKAGSPYIGIPSGFKDLDTVIDGLRQGHLWIIGGYTSSGKTFAALNIVKSLLEQKKRVVVLSLEMSKMQIVGRLIGILAGVNSTEVMKGMLFDQEIKRVEEAKKFLSSSRFAIYNQVNIMDKIKATMYEQMYREPVDLFVLDYLQLVTSGKNKTEYETMRDAVKEFQQIGHKLKVPIILLSQISNESAKMPSSTVMGFKGAGDIAAAADFAIEFQSDERDEQERHRKIRDKEPLDVKAVIKKNRHGRTGVAYLTFDGNTGKFAKRKKSDQAPQTINKKDLARTNTD